MNKIDQLQEVFFQCISRTKYIQFFFLDQCEVEIQILFSDSDQ